MENCCKPRGHPQKTFQKMISIDVLRVAMKHGAHQSLYQECRAFLPGAGHRARASRRLADLNISH
eukprot:1051037-Pyramimonas_sp.AAC.1